MKDVTKKDESVVLAVEAENEVQAQPTEQAEATTEEVVTSSEVATPEVVDLEKIASQEGNPLLARLDGEMQAALKEINDCIMADDVEGAYRAEKALKEVEDKYAEQKAISIYIDLGKTSNPILNAIKLHTFAVKSHRTIKEDGIITEIEMGEKERSIDLYKMCNRLKLPTSWVHYVSKVNQLLCLRTARELKCTASEIRKIATTYFLADKAKRLEMGETPDSTTQICKLLQTAIDAILFEDNGRGENVYKCKSRDVAFLLSLYTKRGKGALSVSVAKDNVLRIIVTTILRRIVCGENYVVDGYKTIKQA